METRARLDIEVFVDCPNCECLIDLMKPTETSGTDHNEDGHILSQACPEGCWSVEHENFELEGVVCSKCSTEFTVKGLDW